MFSDVAVQLRNAYRLYYRLYTRLLVTIRCRIGCLSEYIILLWNLPTGKKTIGTDVIKWRDVSHCAYMDNFSEKKKKNYKKSFAHKVYTRHDKTTNLYYVMFVNTFEKYYFGTWQNTYLPKTLWQTIIRNYRFRKCMFIIYYYIRILQILSI